MSEHLVKAIGDLAERLDGAAVAPSMSVVAAELRAILERYPLPPEDADERDATHWLITQQGEQATRVANAVNGPPPPMVWWSWHDIGEKTEELAAKHKAALYPSPALLDAVAAKVMLDFNVPSMLFARQYVRSVLKHLASGLAHGLR